MSASGAPDAADAAAAIELRGVGVRVRIADEPIRSFKEYLLRRLQGRIRRRDLWALRDLDLRIEPGEFFGLVGNNGAGKSTLLKVICRILRPTSGRVVVRGRVAPLLELNAGFHADLTGVENVFLNAGLLGFPRADVEPHLDEVVDFAELAGFIHLPIRNYSTGMVARLGFAVAAMFRPDILILDEFLAVGDPGFQEKSLHRIQSFCEQGTTVILVSHSLEQVRQNCRRVAWLEHGRLAQIGETASVLESYHRFLHDARPAARTPA
jgi:ABC-type polysaccharide/polyol phosphate transport system ATPase subunit